MSLPPPQPPDEFPSNPDSSYSHFVDEHFTPTNITAALPIVVTIPSHGFSNGQALRATKFISIPFASATGMQQLNNRLFYVQQATTNTFQLFDNRGFPIDGSGYTAYISGGQFTLTGPRLPVVNPSPEPPSGVPAFPPA